MSCAVQLQVNGRLHDVQLQPQSLLIDALRDALGLRGTHQGCDTAQCGACTVQVDGQAVKSCHVLALQVQGQAVQTVEGLAPSPGQLHPMQQAFSKHHALQCGFCTPGLLMRAVALADEPQAAQVPVDPQWVRQALSGNLCRCTGYEGIVHAVCEGLTAMRRAATP